MPGVVPSARVRGAGTPGKRSCIVTPTDSKNGLASAISCCGRLFYAHRVGKDTPLIVLECCTCGRLWHQRQDGELVPYDKALLGPAFTAMLYNNTPSSLEPSPPTE